MRLTLAMIAFDLLADNVYPIRHLVGVIAEAAGFCVSDACLAPLWPVPERLWLEPHIYDRIWPPGEDTDDPVFLWNEAQQHYAASDGVLQHSLFRPFVCTRRFPEVPRITSPAKLQRCADTFVKDKTVLLFEHAVRAGIPLGRGALYLGLFQPWDSKIRPRRPDQAAERILQLLPATANSMPDYDERRNALARVLPVFPRDEDATLDDYPNIQWALQQPLVHPRDGQRRLLARLVRELPPATSEVLVARIRGLEHEQAYAVMAWVATYAKSPRMGLQYVESIVRRKWDPAP
jgi:hypothetical protein